MTRTIIALAAAIVSATTVFAPAAEAGRGLRFGLGFGGPMFHHHRFHQPRHEYRESFHARRAAIARARAIEAQEAAAERREAAAAAAMAKSRKMRAVAEAQKAAAQKAAAAKAAAATAATASAATAAAAEPAATNVVTNADTSLSSTLVANDVAKGNAPANAELIPLDPVASETKPAKTASAGERSTKKASGKAADCKKFIPSVSLTVTVPCS